MTYQAHQSEDVSLKTAGGIIAPHPDLQDAAYCYAHHGDGAGAGVVQGWEALCLLMEDEVGCGPDERWRDILAELDPYHWSNDGNGVPFQWEQSFEDGSVCIYRMDALPPQAKAEPAGVSDEALDAKRWRWLVAQHDTINPIAQVVWKRDSKPNGQWVNLIDGNDLNAHVGRAILSAAPSTGVREEAPSTNWSMLRGAVTVLRGTNFHGLANAVESAYAELTATAPATPTASTGAASEPIIKSQPAASGVPDITSALSSPGVERLREWVEIGPVQRCALEQFLCVLGMEIPLKENGDAGR